MMLIMYRIMNVCRVMSLLCDSRLYGWLT